MKNTLKNHLVKTAFGISLMLGCLPISAQDENSGQAVNGKDARTKVDAGRVGAKLVVPSPGHHAKAGDVFKVPFTLKKTLGSQLAGGLPGMKASLKVRIDPVIKQGLEKLGIKSVDGSVEAGKDPGDYFAVFTIPAKPSGIPTDSSGHEKILGMDWEVIVNFNNPTYGKSSSSNKFHEDFNN